MVRICTLTPNERLLTLAPGTQTDIAGNIQIFNRSVYTVEMIFKLNERILSYVYWDMANQTIGNDHILLGRGIESVELRASEGELLEVI